MFLLNLGYRWTNHELANGVILNASGFHKEQGVRRNIADDLEMTLFDPQLYLAGLEYESCNMTCSRLTTYPWFGGSDTDYDSAQGTAQDWFAGHRQSVNWPVEVPTERDEIRDCIKDCLDYQVGVGVSHLIIPTPIVCDYEDEFAEQLKWIDIALEIKEEYELPVLTSIAINDHLLIQGEPLKNKLVQTILDNISVRTELDGVYVIPVQTNDATVKLDNKNVAEFLLHISNILGHINEKIVIINYTDSFGLACLGVGATAFGSGYGNKTKRMSLNDFRESGGGKSFPKLYANELVMDLLSYRDINKLKDSRLLRLIKNDVTESSQDLINALNAGLTANDVPKWRESINNITTATQHRIQRLVGATEKLQQIESMEDREAYILEWLQNAEAYHLLLQAQFSSEPLSEDGRHIAVWRNAFESYLNNKDM
ncbi:hypothetical protein COK10_19850 [Bacillus anthracis]|nr:hypothetical protein COK10_19850 [Bacillus anthracis]